MERETHAGTDSESIMYGGDASFGAPDQSQLSTFDNALSRAQSAQSVTWGVELSQGTSQKHSSRDRTRPLTHSLPQQTPTIECHDLAGIFRAAAAQVGAPRRVTDFGMLALLLKPARPFLSYACSDILVADRVQVFTDERDMNTFLGLKRFPRGWS